MKKALKIIAIILLITLAVVVAVVLFQKFVIKRDENKVDVVAVALDKKDSDLIKRVNEINSILNSDSTDNRLTVLAKTIEKLDDSMIILGEYFIPESIQDNANIRRAYANMTKDLALFDKMYEEYKVKSKDPLFPRHTGANDIFNTLSDYVVNYSDFISRVIGRLNRVDIDKSLDVKFAIIDLYAKVSEKTYSDLTELKYTEKLDIKSYDNQNYINSKINFASGELTGLLISKYSQQAGMLNEKYWGIDSDSFAKKLVTNLDATTESNKNESNEKMVGYLLIQILGR